MTKTIFKIAFLALMLSQFLISCVEYQHVSIVSDSFRSEINENII